MKSLTVLTDDLNELKSQVRSNSKDIICIIYTYTTPTFQVNLSLVIAKYGDSIEYLRTINVEFESISLTARSSIIQDDELFESFTDAALDPLDGAKPSIRYMNDIILLY